MPRSPPSGTAFIAREIAFRPLWEVRQVKTVEDILSACRYRLSVRRERLRRSLDDDTEQRLRIAELEDRLARLEALARTK